MNQDGEYTKHYYADALRIASKIGSGFSQDLCVEAFQIDNQYPGYLDERRNEQYNEMMEELTELINENQIIGIKPLPYPNPDLCNLFGNGHEPALFFYHPDHLGSSSVSTPLNNHWITYGSGNAIQHLHYLLLKSFAFFPPWRSVKKIYFLYTHCLRRFGEDWVDQRNASWNAPYTFSGKEKDVETGYSYFGARYYDSGLSIWLSVDPMSDKYPNLTPYNYCANNPVMFVDPDGKAPRPGDPPKYPVLKGVLTTAGGVLSVVGGVGLCLTPTGVSQVAGAALISAGVPSIGLGIGQIYDGVTNKGQANIPGGIGEATGQGIDKVTSNENNTFAKTGEFLDILSGGKPQNAAEAVVTGGKLLMIGLEGNKTSTTPKTTNISSENTNNTKKESTPKSSQSGESRFIPVEGSKSKVPPADVKNQY
jgi:RHS repeat-associated protein